MRKGNIASIILPTALEARAKRQPAKLEARERNPRQYRRTSLDQERQGAPRVEIEETYLTQPQTGERGLQLKRVSLPHN